MEVSLQPVYEATADELVRRIRTLIPEHPEILELESPWDLFKVEGFNCADIGPSAFQASWALARAKHLGPIINAEDTGLTFTPTRGKER